MILSAAAVAVCWAATVSAATLTRGPFLQIPTQTSVTIRWRTLEPVDTELSFGTSPLSMSTVLHDDTPTTEHEVLVSDLQPDTRYFYVCGTSTEEFGTGEGYSFRTAPSQPRPVRIWVIGDTRSSLPDSVPDSRHAVRDAALSIMGSRTADLCFNTGDLADNGLDSEMQTAFFDIYSALFRTTPVFTCLGNHDLGHIPRGEDYLQAFSLPDLGQAGGVSSQTERYYSFDYADIHFVVLDCYGPDGLDYSRVDPNYLARQLNWLREDLTANHQNWLVAMFHSPPYTWGSHNSDWEWDCIQARTNFVPVLESFGADLVLNGHSHNYERSFLLRGHFGPSSTLTGPMKLNPGDGRPEGDGAYYKPDRTSGTVYAVVGCSGFLGWGSFGHPAIYYSANQLGSMVIDVAADTLQARFILDTGEVADNFTIIKGDQLPTRITRVWVEESAIHLLWDSVAGMSYRVFRRSQIEASRSPVSGILVAEGPELHWSEPLPTTGAAAAFYQVQTLP